MGGGRGWTECGEEEESQAQQGLERVIFVPVWARGSRPAKRAGKMVGRRKLLLTDVLWVVCPSKDPFSIWEATDQGKEATGRNPASDSHLWRARCAPDTGQGTGV